VTKSTQIDLLFLMSSNYGRFVLVGRTRAIDDVLLPVST